MFKASKHKLTFVFSEECHGGVEQKGSKQDTEVSFLILNHFHYLYTLGYVCSVASPL